MGTYSGVYYPDSRLSTWSNIASYTWADSDLNWATFNSNAAISSTSWSYTTDATDLGSIKSFYPTTEVLWDDSKPVDITYEYSIDGNSYVAVDAQPITARYLKTTITTTGAYLTSILTDINTVAKTETYYNINTSALAGNTTHRVLPTNGFSQIQSISMTPAITESRPITGQLVANNIGNVTIRAINLDTWSKVAVDANVNIVIVGFPIITTNANAGIVY